MGSIPHEIPQEKIDEVRARTDVVGVVRDYVDLRRSGQNLKGLCPFHAEKTPSFMVHPERQIFHCFGCNVGGNVITFLMKIENLAFPQAVERLAERSGIDLPKRRPSRAERKRRVEEEAIISVYRIAVDFYHRTLLESSEGEGARRYLAERGLRPETVVNCRLGYAPDSWRSLHDHLCKKGIDEGLAICSGLVRKKDDREPFDLFRGRILFPILDLSGEPIAFGGRLIGTGEPKYLNSPESAVFSKGSAFYGLPEARDAIRRAREAVIVEGYFDWLTLHQAGIRNTLATLGTALTERHLKLIRRLARSLVLIFDPDEAGLRAMERALPACLEHRVTAKVASLPRGVDPDDFVRQEGAAAFLDRANGAKPIVEFYIDRILGQAGEAAQDRARAIEAILHTLGQVPSEIERRLHLKDLSARTGIVEAVLEEQLARVGRAGIRPTGAAARPPEAARPGGFPAESFLLRLLISIPELCDRVSSSFIESKFISQEYREIGTLLLSARRRGLTLQALLDEITDDGLRASATALIASEPPLGEAEPEKEKVLEDCLRKIERNRLSFETRRLTEEINRARDIGDKITLEALLREKNALNKRIGGEGRLGSIGE